MSSETTVDQKASNDSNHHGPSTKRQNGDSIKSSGVPHLIDGGQENTQQDPTICNHSPKKMKASNTHLACDNNGSSKSKLKQLSFLNNEDDDENSSADSDSSNYVHALVAKDNSKDTLPLVKPNHNGPELDHLKLVARLESANDDASSTSSCSCEDHSSVANRSDNESDEDLDYDDDSVTNSPPRNNKDTRQSTREHLPEQGEASRSNRCSVSGTSPAMKSSSSYEKESQVNSLEENKDTSKSPSIVSSNNNHNDESSSTRNNNNRIKSVINLSHRRKRKEKALSGSPRESADEMKNEKKKSKDRSHKSYEHLMKYFFKDACYFQIKSINHENVEISKSMGVWSTLIPNEIRLNAAFNDHRNVILIFSVQQSGGFQGFARMTSESKPASEPVPWVFPARQVNVPLGGVFKVEWLCTKELSFNETRDLFNPYNGNKPVKVARDGQQVEPDVGQQLCSMFPKDSKDNLLASVATLKRQISQRKKMQRKRESYYPMPNVRGYTTEHHSYNYNSRFMNGNSGDMRNPGPIGPDYAEPSSIPHNHGARNFGRRNRTIEHFNGPDMSRYRFPQGDNYNLSRPFYTAHNHLPGGFAPDMRGEIPFGQPPYHHNHGPDQNPYGPPNDFYRYHPYQRLRR